MDPTFRQGFNFAGMDANLIGRVGWIAFSEKLVNHRAICLDALNDANGQNAIRRDQRLYLNFSGNLAPFQIALNFNDFGAAIVTHQDVEFQFAAVGNLKINLKKEKKTKK